VGAWEAGASPTSSAFEATRLVDLMTAQAVSGVARAGRDLLESREKSCCCGVAVVVTASIYVHGAGSAEFANAAPKEWQNSLQWERSRPALAETWEC
jgi:hypothetical protein